MPTLALSHLQISITFEVTNCLLIKFYFFSLRLLFVILIEKLLIQILGNTTLSRMTFSWTTFLCSSVKDSSHFHGVVQLNVTLLKVPALRNWINNVSIILKNESSDKKNSNFIGKQWVTSKSNWNLGAGQARASWMSQWTLQKQNNRIFEFWFFKLNFTKEAERVEEELAEGVAGITRGASRVLTEG